VPSDQLGGGFVDQRIVPTTTEAHLKRHRVVVKNLIVKPRLRRETTPTAISYGIRHVLLFGAFNHFHIVYAQMSTSTVRPLKIPGIGGGICRSVSRARALTVLATTSEVTARMRRSEEERRERER
jgi:hypothetical protein